MRLIPAPCRRFAVDRRGTAVIELALTLPLLLMLLFGILTGGSWLAMAHAVQQSANEGARAALGGLTSAERATLATSAAHATLSDSYGIATSAIVVSVQDDGRRLAVDVRYDGSGNPLLALPLMPATNRVIDRRAAVLLTGL